MSTAPPGCSPSTRAPGKIEKDPCCCVGCGECVKACPTSAWTRQETKFYRVILGGRTGRQTPRTGKMFLNWATEDVVLGVLKNWQKFSAWVMDYKPEYLHGGHLIDRAGYKKFKEIILEGVELNPECLVAEDIFWHETEYRSNFNVKPVAMHHKAGPRLNPPPNLSQTARRGCRIRGSLSFWLQAGGELVGDGLGCLVDPVEVHVGVVEALQLVVHGFGLGQGVHGLLHQGGGDLAGELEPGLVAAQQLRVRHGVQPDAAVGAFGIGEGGGGADKGQGQAGDEQVLHPVGEQGEGQTMTSWPDASAPAARWVSMEWASP